MEIANHKQRVWEVRVHPSLPYYASVSADKTTQIRSKTDYSLVKELADIHERSIRSIAWRPRKPMLALGSFDATMSVFALEDPNWEFLAQLEGHDNEIKGVAWSPSGQFLASCSRDKSVWVWEVDEDGEDFECAAVLQEHTQDVKHVAWHSTEEVLASASYDNSVRLWRRDDDEWICVSTLEGPDGHKSTVWSCDFDPKSMRLVSVSDDLTTKVWRKVSQSGGLGNDDKLPSVARWDVLSEEWELECDFPKVHTLPIYTVKWGNNGKIVTAGADGKVVVYKPSSSSNEWEVERVIEHAHGVYEINSVDWMNDNEFVSAGDDGSVKLWQL